MRMPRHSYASWSFVAIRSVFSNASNCSVMSADLTTHPSVCRRSLSPALNGFAVLTNNFPVGSEPIDQLSDRIWHSIGPSGPNKVSRSSILRRRLAKSRWNPGIPVPFVRGCQKTCTRVTRSALGCTRGEYCHLSLRFLIKSLLG